MILSALNDYYNRLMEQGIEGVAPIGYSYEGISYVLIISEDGDLVDVQDIRDTSGNKPKPRPLCVPQPEKRTSGVKSNFLWDKTSYILGVSINQSDRVASEHEAFKEFHKNILISETDVGVQALLKFLEKWSSEQFHSSGKFSNDMLDGNFVFRLLGEDKEFLHERQAAKNLRATMLENANSEEVECLVSGELKPIARLHPSIKGVNGAQSSGASIVSFNLDASNSYRKSQGNNAPVSEEVAFSYTTALNYLLRRDSHNRQRIQIGDATVVFWAVSDAPEKAKYSESLFANLLAPPETDDASETGKLRSALEAVSKGVPLKDVDPDLDPETEIFILGLAPNASRLSIRFWERGSLQVFIERLAKHFQDLWLEPPPWSREPGIWRLTLETVPHRKNSRAKIDEVQPQLAGELVRSVLTGSRYPRSLLSNLIMRMRADGDISSLRVAMCKAVLMRDIRKGVKGNLEEVTVSLDVNNHEPGYLLGRLFSALENIQIAALGKQVNATIRDRYYGAASATPASVFPVLIRNAQNHLSRLRKDKPGLSAKLENDLAEIIDGLGPVFPRSLGIEAQGRFAIGYYHQTKARYVKAELTEEGEEA